MRALPISLFGLALLAGCRTEGSSRAGASAEAASATPPRPEPQKFGERVRSKNAASLAGVLQKPAEFQGKEVVVEGHVRRACSRKGCWMELAAGPDAALPGCRVTFKDYGFFVPTDSAGASARVQAQVKVSTISASSVNHLEEEGAQFARKNPDGTAEEVRLVATGVELWR